MTQSYKVSHRSYSTCDHMMKVSEPPNQIMLNQAQKALQDSYEPKTYFEHRSSADVQALLSPTMKHNAANSDNGREIEYS